MKVLDLLYCTSISLGPRTRIWRSQTYNNHMKVRPLYIDNLATDLCYQDCKNLEALPLLRESEGQGHLLLVWPYMKIWRPLFSSPGVRRSLIFATSIWRSLTSTTRIRASLTSTTMAYRNWPLLRECEVDWPLLRENWGWLTSTTRIQGTLTSKTKIWGSLASSTRILLPLLREL